MSNLPLGWGDRHNQMSEHDMKLGGAAATKFVGAKNAYENDAGNTGYKNNDQVRDFYLNGIQKASSSVADGGKGTSNVPDLWEERQKQHDLQAKQMGVFSKNPTANKKAIDDATSSGSGGDSLSAEVALVQCATHTLELMAKSLEGGNSIKIPMKERLKFANALKGAMDALAKQA